MKSSIIAEIQKATPGYTAKADAEKAYDTVVGAIQTVIQRDGTARLPGFGIFKKRFREGRQARNPRTGETVDIAGRDVVSFKQSKSA